MEPKWFLQSKTILGLIVSILPALLPAVGVSFSGDDVGLVNGLVDSLMTFGGALFAAYGRWVAKSPVSAALKPGTPG